MFSLAGIWEGVDTGPGSRLNFVILTTDAAREIADIHHRQPVILDDEGLNRWMDPGWEQDDLVAMTRRGGELAYERRAVDRAVNNPASNSPELLEPLEIKEVATTLLAAAAGEVGGMPHPFGSGEELAILEQHG